MDLALEAKMGKGRVRGKNSHPTFLDWKLDGVGKIFGGRRGREGTIQKKWRGPKSAVSKQLTSHRNVIYN